MMSTTWMLPVMMIMSVYYNHHHHQQQQSVVCAAPSSIWSLLTPKTSSSTTTRNKRLLSTSKAETNTASDVIATSSTGAVGMIRELQDMDENASDITNPYISGCLYNKGLVSHKRVCNSEDTTETIASGMCRSIPDFDYMEIRIHTNNWESITFEAWIIQMILSEILDVPTTVEPGNYGGSLNFYHPQSDMTYVVNGNDTALQHAYEIQDCRLANQLSLEEYEPCAHVYPERWTSIQYDSPLHDLVHNGIVEPPYTLGVLGLETWFITKFTVENDPTLTSYFGMSGEQYRTKLAETFLRPTTWYEYCTEVSDNNCTTPNDVAQRFPATIDEQEQFFSKDNYIGHFRKTDDNNCTLNPTTCTGHVADYPCGWNSYMIPQLHYLNIALKSTGNEGLARGYSYSRLGEMWRAANATKSNLIMQYWSPEPLNQEFLGTDAEMFRVSMPSRTQECLDKRRPQGDMCSENFELRVGEPEGICEESSKPLWKVLVGNLYDIVNDPEIPVAVRSPAYDVLQLFQISELQLGQLFNYRRDEDMTPRDAVCRWVSENPDYLHTFVPRSYPRTIRSSVTDSSENTNEKPLTYVATIMGGITSVIVLITWYFVYVRRDTVQAIRSAQIEFLHLLLAGSLAIGIGSIIVGLPPTDVSCATAIWFINLGYTLELVPLIVKIAAINKLIGAARQFRRVVLKRRTLFGAVFGISGVVFIFLLLWTILDPPNKNQDYSLSSDVVSDPLGNNRTVVDVVYFCSSESMVWDYVAIGWNFLLLLCATVLAVQTRTVQKDFNESQTLAFLIYSHFLFVLLRLILLLIAGSLSTSSSISESTLSGLRSLIFSVDTMATIIIYFLPKFVSSNTDNNRSSYSFSGMNFSGSAHTGSIDTFANNRNNVSPSHRQSIMKQGNDNEGDRNITEKDTTEVSINPVSYESFVSTSSHHAEDPNNEIEENNQADEETEEDIVAIADSNDYIDYGVTNNEQSTDMKVSEDRN